MDKESNNYMAEGPICEECKNLINMENAVIYFGKDNKILCENCYKQIEGKTNV